ncbi:MAG TPA: hypothetical protein VFR85_21780 [Anaeromyxobacteraceae bacterium]|nr:hypothetical protein [Anaeromyxobacteraceae bacterium]
MIAERRLPLVAAVAAAAVAALATPARAGEKSGLSLGARVGYGIPLGDAMSGVSLADVVSGQVPIEIDALWRFDRHWRLGLYAQYGFATVAGASCPGGASCSGQNLRAGVQAAYAFAAGDGSPWIGAGLGLDWQAVKVTAGGVENQLRLFGLEPLSLQGGWDFRPAGGFSLGPFASFSLGLYQTATSGGASESLTNALHGWIQIGVKGAFDL